MQPNLEPGGSVRSGPPTADLHLQHRPGYHIVVLSLRAMRLRPFPPSPRVSFTLPLPPEQTAYDKIGNIDFSRVFYKKLVIQNVCENLNTVVCSTCSEEQLMKSCRRLA